MSIWFPPGVLPYCVFSDSTGRRRLGVGSGSDVIDLSAGSFESVERPIVDSDRLNPLLEAGRTTWEALREELVVGEADGTLDHARRDAGEVSLHLAWDVADYVDFYSSRHHAENVGRIFRPDGDPLPENWLHLPAGYHGRSGTVVVDGTPVRRPLGQTRRPDGVMFGPSAMLDFELEVGYVLGGRSEFGEPVPIDQAEDHLFGVVLVNDWSARDIQAWEYVPLGPFLGKSFATSVSAWVMPLAALEAQRVTPAPQHPTPPVYLRAGDAWTLRMELEVWLETSTGAGERLAVVDTAEGLYWTPAQQLAHLTVNGASVRPGDLFATGTVSTADQYGCLLERTRGGGVSFLVGDELRTYLADGDRITLRGWAGEVPLGPVSGQVIAARTQDHAT
ncbi:MAG: fumarylacetoacetate hydrolase family protein [Acidimicrobiia bacterium]